MFLLKKIFNVREKSSPEGEMTFLEHLEDLRKVITKIVLTLLISTLICFTYKSQLIDIIRRPLDKMWIEQQSRSLPIEKVSFAEWESAKQHAEACLPLSNEQRAAFFSQLEPKTRFNAESALLFRSVAQIPKEKQQAYIGALPGISDEMRGQLKALSISSPSVQLYGGHDARVMTSLKPTETFMLSMKLSFFAGIAISFPLLMYFILQFILPGLHKHEKRAMWPALFIGFLLFLGGISFAYFVVMPRMLEFFYTFSSEIKIQNDWRIGEYISFATQFVLIFGLAFELPVVIMTLVKIGILNYDMMRSTRSYAVLGIVVLSAVITPTPDIATATLLAVPMYLLYEICIWLSYFIDKKEKAREAAEERAYLDRVMRDAEVHTEPENHALTTNEGSEPDDEYDAGKPI